MSGGRASCQAVLQGLGQAAGRKPGEAGPAHLPVLCSEGQHTRRVMPSSMLSSFRVCRPSAVPWLQSCTACRCPSSSSRSPSPAGCPCASAGAPRPAACCCSCSTPCAEPCCCSCSPARAGPLTGSTGRNCSWRPGLLQPSGSGSASPGAARPSTCRDVTTCSCCFWWPLPSAAASEASGAGLLPVRRRRRTQRRRRT